MPRPRGGEEQGVVRKRGSGQSGPPERLLRLRVADWPDPGPEPHWWHDDGAETWPLHTARIAWQLARMDWIRDNGRTAAVLDALFGPDFDPASDDRAGVRERRRLERVMLARDEWTAAAGATPA